MMRAPGLLILLGWITIGSALSDTLNRRGPYAHRGDDTFAPLPAKIFASMLPAGQGDATQTDSTLWRDPVLPLVPYDSQYRDNHEEIMTTARAWASDAQAQATEMSERASLLKDRAAHWSSSSLDLVARAQRSAADASLACYEAIVTADKFAPEPEEQRLKTEITLRDLVVKAVKKASDDTRGSIAREAGTQMAAQVAAEETEKAAALIGISAPPILAQAQSLLTKQLSPGAIRAAQAEAESAKAQGVVLHVAEAAANWGVRKVSLTSAESDAAVMFAAKDDALLAAKKATHMLCKDAALQAARGIAERRAAAAVREAVVEDALRAAESQLEQAKIAAKRNITLMVGSLVSESAEVLAHELQKYELAAPSKATLAQHFGELQAPVHKAAMEAATAAETAECKAAVNTIKRKVQEGLSHSPPKHIKPTELVESSAAQVKQMAIAAGQLAAHQVLKLRAPEVRLTTAAAVIADASMANLDISSLLAIPAADKLERAAANGTRKVATVLRDLPNTNRTLAQPAVLNAAISGAREAVGGLSVPSMTMLAKRAATARAMQVLAGATEEQTLPQVAADAVQQAQQAAERAVARFVEQTTLGAARSAATKAAEKLLSNDLASHAVDQAVESFCQFVATNVSTATVRRLANAAAEQVVQQGLATVQDKPLAAAAAEEEAMEPAHEAALDAARAVLTEEQTLKKAVAVATGAVVAGRTEPLADTVRLFLQKHVGLLTIRAAEGAALAAAAPIVEHAAQNGAQTRLLQQLVKAAVRAVPTGELQTIASSAINQVAADAAVAQVGPLAAQVGVSAPDKLKKMEARGAQTVAHAADLSSLQEAAVNAGIGAAKQSARQAAAAALKGMSSEQELARAETGAATEAREAARQAAHIATENAARATAQARLLDPQVAADVASELRAAVRTDLASRMTEHATAELAETASDEAAQWAAHAAIPTAVGKAMQAAAHRVVRNQLASDLEVASATTDATRAVQDAVSHAVKEAARQAVHGVVTSDVAAMARAAVDHAISISYGDDQQQVAQAAATQTVQSACMVVASQAAQKAAGDSAKAAANAVAQKIILDTIKAEVAKKEME